MENHLAQYLQNCASTDADAQIAFGLLGQYVTDHADDPRVKYLNSYAADNMEALGQWTLEAISEGVIDASSILTSLCEEQAEFIWEQIDLDPLLHQSVTDLGMHVGLDPTDLMTVLTTNRGIDFKTYGDPDKLALIVGVVVRIA